MSAPRPSVLVSAIGGVGGAFAGLMVFSMSPDVSSPVGVISMGGGGAIVGLVLARRLFTDPTPRERSPEEIELAFRRDLRAGFGILGAVVGGVGAVILRLNFPFFLALAAVGAVAGVEIPVLIRDALRRDSAPAAAPPTDPPVRERPDDERDPSG